MIHMTTKNISEIVQFEQPTIHQPTWTIFSIHFFQKESILALICNNSERSFPKILKLSMLTFIFISRLPFHHYVFYLKLDRLFLSIIYFLDSLLQLESVLKNSSLVCCKWIIWLILHCKWSSSLPASGISLTTGTAREVQNTVSTPYMSSKGDMPIYLFWLTLSAQSELTEILCQLFLFVSNSFLIILTKDLFEDSTNPLPYG